MIKRMKIPQKRITNNSKLNNSKLNNNTYFVPPYTFEDYLRLITPPPQTMNSKPILKRFPTRITVPLPNEYRTHTNQKRHNTNQKRNNTNQKRHNTNQEFSFDNLFNTGNKKSTSKPRRIFKAS